MSVLLKIIGYLKLFAIFEAIQQHSLTIYHFFMRIHYLRSIIAGCIALTASGAFAQQQLPYSCALNTQALFDT